MTQKKTQNKHKKMLNQPRRDQNDRKENQNDNTNYALLSVWVSH